ncbi:MAG: hypothetical protein JJLCMIEE_02503 [Acidimicrobiales bacterium]|nr:hypothetical protein [Acidimicrobiales bacterium]
MRPPAVIPLTLTILLLAASPATAHEDVGEMTVTGAEQIGPDLVRVEIGLLYADDGHFAEGATVSATFTAVDGSTVGPVPLAWLRDALYAAEVDLPAAGTWTVEVSSVEPTGTATASVEVTEEGGPTTAPTTAPATSTTTTATTATAPGNGDEAGEGAEDGGSSFPWLAIVAAGAALALVVVGAWLLIPRRRTDTEEEAAGEEGESFDHGP